MSFSSDFVISRVDLAISDRWCERKRVPRSSKFILLSFFCGFGSEVCLFGLLRSAIVGSGDMARNSPDAVFCKLGIESPRCC